MKQNPTRNTRYLTKQGKVTTLLKQQLEEILKSYVGAAEFWAGKRGKIKEDYTVREAFIYVRPYDEFPDRPSFEITSQVRYLLDRYNRELTAAVPA